MLQQELHRRQASEAESASKCHAAEFPHIVPYLFCNCCACLFFLQLLPADVFSRALVAAALARPAEGIEESAGWLVKPTTAVIGRVLEIPTYKKQLRAMEQSWLQHAPPCPKLFLYSDADALIQPAAVEAFMEQLGRAGSETFRHKWGDSEHVSHFRQYPEEYTQQLVQFVKRVLPEQQVLTEQQDVPTQQQVLPEQQQQQLVQQA